ncbi:hypothetical protein GKZ90_0012495 [Flavobacterium sp. MC2016-06]|jgi:hypothetical protein|uniref:hypothetical protein n=1 Tax=Flavobacterium sp. MC2016-06 TaxID=2676308 RepID=UPI0012BAA45B|nr:hypothetical protein [Flavobacterium sp. MC2016-06]MBU3860129.1 hypothetical protein [Flavobacterium sp. MC2016-06]
MATDKNILKNWFTTGKKPLQAQFWAWMDSYWHKEEPIPQITLYNQFSIFKVRGNTNNLIAEVNDVCKGIVENYLIEGIYLSGDMTRLTDFEIITKQEL